MRRFFTAILLVLALVGAARADIVPWRVKKTQHFLIHYAPGKEATAERAALIAEEWHAKLSEKLEFSPTAVTPVYLYPDRQTFSEATGVGRADRTVGLAQARVYWIKIDASGAFSDIEEVIPHELVHVFVSKKLRGTFGDVPLWMHEGLATYLAGDWSPQDAELLADAATRGETFPLEKIEDLFPTGERERSIAYVQSYSIVKFIADQYGEDTLAYILSETAGRAGFDTALRYGTGKTPTELEMLWREFIWKEYAANRVLRTVAEVGSAVMGVLAVLAFRARLIRKRRTAEALEQDDPENEEEAQDES